MHLALMGEVDRIQGGHAWLSDSAANKANPARRSQNSKGLVIGLAATMVPPDYCFAAGAPSLCRSYDPIELDC